MKKHLKRVSNTRYEGTTFNEFGQPIKITIRKRKKTDKFPVTRHLQDIIFGRKR